MRILSVTASYFPFLEFGGPPVKVQALAAGLSKRGHQVTVLTPDWGLAARLGMEIADGRAKRSPFGWQTIEEGVHALYLPIRLRYRSLSWTPAVHRFCRSQLAAFDVAHIFGLYDLLGPAVASHCRALGKPYVVEPIGMFRPIVRNLQGKRLYHALWGHPLLRHAARVIATSEQEVLELQQGGLRPEKILMRRNGVRVPVDLPQRGAFRQKLGIPPDHPMVLFLGRLSRKKSPELLLRAVARMRSKGREKLTLVYAGPDSEKLENSLRREAAERGISEQVLFSGPVYGQEKWMAYRDADVFVLPSQNENFGNSAAEAVACRVPTIVTEQCGIAAMLGDAALVVRHEVVAIHDALEQVLCSAELRKQMREASSRITAQLGWQEPIEQMASMYTTLASGQSQSAQ
jgi:glycosyltransferase involved in cell wall biosynthesis